MKAVIPVAGIGTKLRPHTHTQPKTLVPIAGKPILAHIVDRLLEGGIKEFLFIIGYLGDKIEAFLTTNYPDLAMEFVTQEPREGLAHALWVAKDKIDAQEELLIVLGDTIANVELKAFFDSEHSVLGVQRVANPNQFGIAEIDKDGFIVKLLEKPRIPKSNLALVGMYKIKNTALLMQLIAEMIQQNLRNNGEFYLTDALMLMIEQGEKFITLQVDNWFDCGRKETLLEANAILLNRDSFMHQAYQFPQTIIIPPVSIGEHCDIQSSIIGPNVAIGDHTILKHSIVQNSIIGSFSELQDVVLKTSIVGNDTSIKGISQSLNIGDSTEINFGL